jgi:hypothetical protein
MPHHEIVGFDGPTWQVWNLPLEAWQQKRHLALAGKLLPGGVELPT